MSSDSPCLTAVKAALLREAETTCAQPPAFPQNAAALAVMCLLRVTTVVPDKAPLYGSLAAACATERSWHCQQHPLATADSSKPFLNARGGNGNPPFVGKPGCFGEQRHCGCTHCVHGTWAGRGEAQLGSWVTARIASCVCLICPSGFKAG